jgi:hypothetical protein
MNRILRVPSDKVALDLPAQTWQGEGQDSPAPARASEGHSVNTGPISCLTCRQRVAICRGCCHTCYGRHHVAVAAGKTTWAELVRRGLAGPAHPVGHAWRDWGRGRSCPPSPPVAP